MGGAQPLAATMNGACFLGIEVDPRAHPAAPRDRLLRPHGNAAWTTRCAMLDEAQRARRGDLGGPGGQLRRRAAGAGAARHRARRAHRPDQRARSAQRLRAQRHDAGGSAGAARARSGRVRASAPWQSMARTRASHAGAAAARRGDLRLRQQHPHAGQAGRRGATPSTFPASCPSTSGRCSAKAAGRSAGWRFRAIRRTSTAPTRLALRTVSATNETLARWIPLAQKRIHFQGLPARICWLGYGERAEFGVAINRLVRDGRVEGADRDRPRSSGCRLGGLALPRDRRHARRLATPSPTGRCSTRW